MAGADDTAGKREPWHAKLNLKPLEDWLSLAETAKFLGISREAVHRLIKRGTLKARTVGDRPTIVIHVKSVEKLPMSPQRRRELRLREQGEREKDNPAEFGSELPEG